MLVNIQAYIERMLAGGATGRPAVASVASGRRLREEAEDANNAGENNTQAFVS